MSNIVLLVFEGETFERKVFRTIKEHFFSTSGKIILRASFKKDIFQLWDMVKSDPDLNIVEILKETNNSDIKDVSRSKVSEIHLFFDHDAHSRMNSVSPIQYYCTLYKMLQTFNNE